MQQSLSRTDSIVPAYPVAQRGNKPMEDKRAEGWGGGGGGGKEEEGGQGEGAFSQRGEASSSSRCPPLICVLTTPDGQVA